jgi:hypothetical protein
MEKGEWSLKNLTIYIIVMTLFFMALAFGVTDYITDYIKEKYHNYQLTKVEQIYIENDSLIGNTVNNINNYGLVAETVDSYYYIKQIQIYQSDKDFTNEVLLVGEPINPGKDTINVLENWIFYRQGAKINRLDIRDGNIKTIFRGHSLQMQVLGKHIYFINLDDDYKLYRMDVNGQNKEILHEEKIIDMAIYDSKIYYSYENNGEDFLERMDIDGREKEFLTDVKAKNMVKDNEYIYYLDVDKDQLCRMKLEDYTIESLSNEKIFTFVKDNEYIFYTLKKPQKNYFEIKGLYKMDIDGGNKITIDGESYLDTLGLGLTEEWIFYNVMHGSVPYGLKRVSKDGLHIIDMDIYE